MAGLDRITRQQSAGARGEGSPLVLPAIAIGTALAPLNSTMIAVALPDIQVAFGVSLTATTWLVAIYLVTMAVGQPICGRLGDLYGRRRMYLLGLAWFALASVACAFAPSLPWLLIFRGQQALAGALCIPNGIALVREAVPVERRGQAFGIIGLAAGAAAAAGPPIGGLLVHAGGWPAIFWANVPVLAVSSFLAARALPVATSRRSSFGRFDIEGSVFLALALGAVIMLPTAMEQVGIPGLTLLSACAVVFALLFVRRELRVTSPVVNLALFRHRHYAWACASVALSNFVLYTTLLAMPQLLEHVWGHGVQTVGFVLAAMSAFAAFLGPLGGRWADRWGYWWPAVVGSSGYAIGTIMLTLSTTFGGLTMTVVSLGVMGLGLGISGAPVQTAAVESVPHDQTASASGIFSTFRYLGSVTGITLLAFVLSGEPGPGDDGAFTLLFVSMSIASLLGVLVNRRVADRPPAT